MTSGGYGGGPYGGGAYGGSALALLAAQFDLYCFEPCDPMLNILGSPIVSATGSGTQFVVDYPDGPGVPNVTCDLGILSGEVGAPTFSTLDARLDFSVAVPDTFTFDFIVTLEAIPPDFSNLSAQHIGFFTTDSAGPCAGLFISQVGIAYAGGVHHDGGGNMILDSALQIIPDTADLIKLSTYLHFRIAADDATQAVYVFVTPAADVSVTGHRLVAILPVIDASALAFPPVNRSLVTVRGTTGQPSRLGLDTICLASSVIIPNLAPIADAGEDQAIRFCSVAKLDGSASFDPEGAPVTYQWRLIDAPTGSTFAVEGNDGAAFSIDATAFTDKFHSPTTLAALDATDPIVANDVLIIQGVARTVVSTGVDGNGFFLIFGNQDIPNSLGPNEPFKVLRQRAVNNPTSVMPTFFPDTPGFYKFDLVVCDGALESAVSTVILNVLESPLPRGCTPNLEFMFGFLSDFWNLVEERDVIPVFWGALAQTAATELFTLWQLEYSKSLRDVQRQFVRRWLHYDLLLGEPIPELTRIRAVWGGITSEPIPAAGVATGDFTLDISSSIFDSTQTFTITVPSGTLTRANLAAQLTLRLSEIDSRFSVETFDNRTTTNEHCRIDAPFPLTIESTSTVPSSVFTVGQQNTHPSNTTGGAAIGQGAYRVDRSLKGLGIVEDDFLVLGGQVLRIARVIDNASDDFPFQRLVIKEDLPLPASTSWAIPAWASSELLDFFNGLITNGDVLTFEVVDNVGKVASNKAENALVETSAFGASEGLPSRVPFSPLLIGGALARPDEVVVRLASVLRRTHIPIDDLVQDIPTLSERIVIETTAHEQAVLRRNVDFFIEEFRGHNSVRFVSGASTDPGDIFEGVNPPDRMWAEYTFMDNRPLIEGNFGIPAEFTLDDLSQIDVNVDYLSAVRGLWYAFFNGPTLQNLRIGTQILLGLPFAEVNGAIEEIRTDFSPKNGRILVRDTDNEAIVRSYEYPRVLQLEINPETKVRYAVGDTVAQFAPLVEGASIVDWVKDPSWFEGLLNQGVFFEVEKFHKFLVSVDSAAFSLSALLFVRNFILKIKPTYTFPLIVVEKEVDDAEVDVTDEVSYGVCLKLNESPCNTFGAAASFDDYRAAGGGSRNKFDHNDNLADPDPTFPTSDTVIGWAYDKDALCPAEALSAEACTPFSSGGTINFDSGFDFDSGPFDIAYYFQRFPGGSGAFLPDVGTYSVPHDGGDPTDTVHVAGTLDKAKVHASFSTASGSDPRVKATGTITTVAGSSLVDGETFTLSDSVIGALIFEFDDDSSVAAGNVPVSFTGASTPDDIRDAIISAVNGSPIRITASDGGAATVSLLHDDFGTVGNIVITETVAAGGFVVSGMSGGVDANDFILVVLVNAVEQAAVPFTFNFMHSDTAAVNFFMNTEVTIPGGVAVSSTAATGTITTIAGSLLVDGETFTLDDGMHPTLTFEFDSGVGVAAGNIAVPFTGGDTADQIRDAAITSINTAPNMDITASNGGAATVGLANKFGGPDGNTTNSETVANAGFVITNMTGGTGDTLSCGLRAGSSPGKTYPWGIVRIRLYQEDEIAGWNFGDGLPTGVYCSEKAVVP